MRFRMKRLLNRDAVPRSAQHFSLRLYLILVFLVGIFPAHAQSGGDARAPSPTHPQLSPPTQIVACSVMQQRFRDIPDRQWPMLWAVLVKNQTA